MGRRPFPKRHRFPLGRSCFTSSQIPDASLPVFSSSERPTSLIFHRHEPDVRVPFGRWADKLMQPPPTTNRYSPLRPCPRCPRCPCCLTIEVYLPQLYHFRLVR